MINTLINITFMGKWIDRTYTRSVHVIRQIPDIFANASNLDGKSFARLIRFAGKSMENFRKHKFDRILSPLREVMSKIV